MPKQQSSRGIPVTSAAFEQAFETALMRFGTKGLNISNAPDALEEGELSRMRNVTHRQDFAITSRPGQLEYSNAGTRHHTIRRLNDPQNSRFTRVYGIDGDLYYGNQGVLSNIDTGFSGNPLTMVPYRPTGSSAAWMYIGDSVRMRKVAPDGTDLPIGLPAPVTPPTASLGPLGKTRICDFSIDTGDGNYAAWTANAGTRLSDDTIFTDAPTGSDDGTIVGFQVNPGAALPEPHYSFWGLPRSLDLTVLDTTGDPADDDDLIFISMQMSHPHFTDEVRIYFVCSPTFNPTSLPGINGSPNTDAYVKSFRGNDIAAYIQARATVYDAAETARIRQIRDDKLRDGKINDTRDSWAERRAAVDPYRQISFQGAPSGFLDFGTVGLPLRRGDFQRIGQNPDRNWGTITGMIVYLGSNAQGGPIAVALSNCYLHGGAGPDTTEPGASQYDWRYTNYDPRTGAEGNPSDIMDEANFLDSERQSVILTPVAYGDAAVIQRFYRRGGTLSSDWFFLGENTADGAQFIDDFSDFEIEAAGSVEIDNYQPVPTVTDSGISIYNQPLTSLWGPLDDLIFGCGDKYRPGHVYFSKRGNPDSWPAENITEVCSPSDELMNGCLFGGQSFVFSRERLYVLYPNSSSDSITVTSTVTQCKRGLASRWALTVGIGGIFFVAPDGVYRTLGGPEEKLSKDIDPLFRGKSANGCAPIDFGNPELIRLEIFENDLYFQYKDEDGGMQCMVYSLLYDFWRQYTYGQETACFYTDEGNPISTLFIGGLSSGKTYQVNGFNDDGTAIDCELRTALINFGRPREEKRLGDQFLDVDTQGVDITLHNRLNDETVENNPQTLSAAAGRKRAIFDSFGTVPQRVRNITTDLSWSSSTAAPIIYQGGTSIILEPEVTLNRVTQWEDLGADEAYLTGVTFDCDTGGTDRTIYIEYDFNGTVNTAAILTVNTTERHKVKFSWAAVQAHKVRIRPDGDCEPWILYRADWIALPEPPRIARWDTHFENGWDQYYTGLDLFCDTNGLDKTIEVFVDEVLVKTETVNTNGRKVHHITLPWGRGHVFRFRATDDNPGLLYDYRWQLEAEPSEQANWNQNFTVAGTEADKFLKAIVFQCDTFGANKTVTVECDGAVVETLTINSNGRRVVQKAFPQHLGRVFRIYPTDSNPGRLYSVWWVFDQEPLALDRWETQQITHGFEAWHYPTHGHVTLKSTADVTLSVTAYNQSGEGIVKTYTIPSTEGDKIKTFLGLYPTKGVMYKYVLTSPDPFWLYREETVIFVREWGTDRTAPVHIFGNDDLDSTRGMAKSELAAARTGGTA